MLECKYMDSDRRDLRERLTSNRDENYIEQRLLKPKLRSLEAGVVVLRSAEDVCGPRRMERKGGKGDEAYSEHYYPY